MKKLIYILTFNCLLLIPSTRDCYSQPSITWQRSYPAPVSPPENSGNCICRADSNNFFIIGTTNTNLFKAYIVKINPYGDTIWTKLIDSLDAFAAVSSGSDECVFTGYNQSYIHYSYLVKINSNGNIEWFKSYPPLDLVTCWRIIKTSDNGYITCGYRGYYEGYILKIDSNGNFQWDKSYHAGYSKFYYGITEAIDGGYLAVGTRSDTAYIEDGVISKIDILGNIIWEKKYRLNNRGVDFETIYNTSVGYVASGTCYDPVSGKARACLIRINNSGDTLYTRVFGGDTDKTNRLEDMKIIDNNKYVFSEVRFHPNFNVSSRSFITDSIGNILKFRIFNETSIIGLNRILPLSNGDIMFIGDANYVNQNFENAHVIRADSNLYAPPIGVLNNKSNVAQYFILHQNYPNPFNPNTIIKYDLPKDGFITFKIYDVLGKELYSKTEFKTAGTYQISLDGSNYASGLYFYRIEVGSFVQTRKMVLIK